MADDFELPDQEGRPWRLSGALAKGPVLLVFFRGDW
jgi:peroxiredoxin